MSSELTYLLSPGFYFKRDGPIALGNIVADPFRPHVALTTLDTFTLAERYPEVKIFADFNSRLANDQDKNASMSTWIQFLDTANTKISVAREKYGLDRFTMTSLETEHFSGLPSKEEIKSRVNVARIREVVLAFREPQPLYMVTGRKLAKGFQKVEDMGKRGSGNLQPHTVTSRRERDFMEDQMARDKLVFAYQLMKIELKGDSDLDICFDTFRHEEAFLNINDEDLEGEASKDIEFEVEIATASVTDLNKMICSEDKLINIEVGEGDEKIWLVWLEG